MAEARAYAARNRQGSDWFGHNNAASPAGNKAPAPAKETPAKETPQKEAVAKNGDSAATGRTQMIKPSCNSNQWFKCDEPSSDGTPKKQTPKGKTAQQSSGEWFTHDSPSADGKVESKPRVVTSEGASYCRRDKTGSSATWFSHEHEKEQTPKGAGPRVTSKEGSGNASRMRGESENWFSHDDKAKQSPTHMSKGRGVQPHSNEMHQIFHMDAAGK